MNSSIVLSPRDQLNTFGYSTQDGTTNEFIILLMIFQERNKNIDITIEPSLSFLLLRI